MPAPPDLPAAAPARLPHAADLDEGSRRQLLAQLLSPDVAVRRALAARRDVPPEILFLLVRDADTEVRRLLAENPALPRRGDEVLSCDPCEATRISLARKLAQLARGFDATDRAGLAALSRAVLERLARDQAVLVRRILAEVLADHDAAPAGVIRQLARDVEAAVACPVLSLSPILTDEDLLEVICTVAEPEMLTAICHRQTVSGPVSDALVAAGNEEVITHLLSNPSAQIREETLDLLIDRAPQVPPWHAPLVRRPVLTRDAIQRLAGFVADTLLRELQSRPEVDRNLALELAQTVARRLREQPQALWVAEPLRETPGPERMAPAGGRGIPEEVVAAHQQGRLDEAMIADLLRQGRRSTVVGALALRTETTLTRVEEVLSSRQPKAIVALCWRAGLSMGFAVTIQSQLCRIEPIRIILGDARGYPLDEMEMRRQLAFFGITG